jgi:hypothetical protein
MFSVWPQIIMIVMIVADIVLKNHNYHKNLRPFFTKVRGYFFEELYQQVLYSILKT